MGASSLLDVLDTMFTVIAIGLVVITATFVVPRHRNIHVFNVLAARWAFGLIVAKRVDNEQMFSWTMHLIEIVTILYMLPILLFLGRPDRASLQDVLWMVIELARPSAPFFLPGLAITGYGMFLHGDFNLIFLALIVINAGRKRAREQRDDAGLKAGGSLLVYILVLLVATAIGNQ